MEDKDPQIASCLRSRKKSVLNKPWDIIPASEKNRDMRIAEFTKQALSFHRWRETRFEMLDFIAKGLFIGEIMWARSNGDIVVGDIKGRNPDNFLFDKQGKLKFRSRTNPSGEDIPQEKFIYIRNEPYAENPYGNPVLKECFWYYWFKKLSVKFLMKFQEQFGSPTTVATYPPNMNTEQKRALEDVMENIQNATKIRKPEGILIEFLEATRRGDAGYLPFIEYCDQQFAKAIHGQTLTSGEGTRVGSMALGKVHEETRQEYIGDDCETLMDAINMQLIPQIVDYNYSGVTQYPQFKIHYEPPEDLVNEVKRDEVLVVKIGLPVTVDWLYDKYSIPRPEEGEELLQVPTPRQPGFSQFSEKRFSRKRGFRIASTAKIQDKYKRIIEKLLMEMEPEYIALIQENRPLGVALEALVREKFGSQLEGYIPKAVEESIVLGAQSMADQLRVSVNKGVFSDLMDKYLSRRAYEKGTIPDIARNLRTLLADKAQNLLDAKITPTDVAAQIKQEFPALADWKAKQIAKTEIATAADYAGTQMVKRSGLPVDAWFYVDPASCDVCQEWASKNPYALADAERMGLPHPHCDDQWVFTIHE